MGLSHLPILKLRIQQMDTACPDIELNKEAP